MAAKRSPAMRERWSMSRGRMGHLYLAEPHMEVQHDRWLVGARRDRVDDAELVTVVAGPPVDLDLAELTDAVHPHVGVRRRDDVELSCRKFDRDGSGAVPDAAVRELQGDVAGGPLL